MQISVLLAEQIAELFLMILMGYVIVKLGLVTDDDSKILSKIVLYIVIPCVMINAFQIDYTPDKVQWEKYFIWMKWRSLLYTTLIPEI